MPVTSRIPRRAVLVALAVAAPLAAPAGVVLEATRDGSAVEVRVPFALAQLVTVAEEAFPAEVKSDDRWNAVEGELYGARWRLHRQPFRPSARPDAVVLSTSLEYAIDACSRSSSYSPCIPVASCGSSGGGALEIDVVVQVAWGPECRIRTLPFVVANDERRCTGSAVAGALSARLHDFAVARANEAARRVAAQLSSAAQLPCEALVTAAARSVAVPAGGVLVFEPTTLAPGAVRIRGGVVSVSLAVLGEAVVRASAPQTRKPLPGDVLASPPTELPFRARVGGTVEVEGASPALDAQLRGRVAGALVVERAELRTHDRELEVRLSVSGKRITILGSARYDAARDAVVLADARYYDPPEDWSAEALDALRTLATQAVALPVTPSAAQIASLVASAWAPALANANAALATADDIQLRPSDGAAVTAKGNTLAIDRTLEGVVSTVAPSAASLR